MCVWKGVRDHPHRVSIHCYCPRSPWRGVSGVWGRAHLHTRGDDCSYTTPALNRSVLRMKVSVQTEYALFESLFTFLKSFLSCSFDRHTCCPDYHSSQMVPLETKNVNIFSFYRHISPHSSLCPSTILTCAPRWEMKRDYTEFFFDLFPLSLSFVLCFILILSVYYCDFKMIHFLIYFNIHSISIY